MRHRTRPQKAIHNSKARFNVAAWGRQSGKTTYGIDKMLYRPLMGRPSGKYWFVEPTYDLAKQAFKRHCDLLKGSEYLLRKKPHETDLLIPYVNGADVTYKSGEVFENLRMETLDGCVIDEVRQQRKELWSRVIRPMLAKHKGWCDFLSSCNGFDHFYDLHERAKSSTANEWAAFNAPSSEAPWWTPEELASAREDMSPEEYAQEIEAEFRNIHQGKAYSSEGIWNRLIASPFVGGTGEPCTRWLPVTVALDFNVNPMSWHLGQFRGETSYWFDEIHVENTNTEECAKELIEKLVELRTAGQLSQSHPQVQLVGDASGNSRHTQATQSDYDIICMALDGAGISWTNATPESNPPVKQRVNTMNTRLKNAAGNTTLFYHPGKCPKFGRDLERVSWKVGAESILDQKKDKTLTHASDGVGYALCVFSPIELYGAVGKLYEVHAR